MIRSSRCYGDIPAEKCPEDPIYKVGGSYRPSPARSRHLVIDLARDGVPADPGGTRKAHRTSSIGRVDVPRRPLAHVSLESVHFAGLTWSAAMREY